MFHKRRNLTTKMSEVDKLLTWYNKDITRGLLDNDFVPTWPCFLPKSRYKHTELLRCTLKGLGLLRQNVSSSYKNESPANIIPGVLRSLFSI